MPANLIPLAIAGVNAAGNMLSNAYTNGQNIGIMHEQQRWSERMWQMQNAYNSPMAQMSRLREAGINPALAYAQGGIENTADSQAQSVESAKMIPYRMDLDPNMFAQGELMRAQAENLRADAQLKLSQVPEAQQRIAEIKQKILNYQQDIKESDARINEIASHIRLMDEQQRMEAKKQIQMDLDNEFRSNEFEEMCKVYASQIGLNEANTEKAKAEMEEIRRKIKEMVETFAIRKAGLQKDNTLKDDQHNLNVEELNKLFEEIGLLKFEKKSAEARASMAADEANLLEDDRIYHFLSMLTSMLGRVFTGSVAKMVK